MNLDKINRVLSVHRAKELTDSFITKREFDIIQQLLWIKWEYNSFKRIKDSYKKTYIINKLIATSEYLCDRYLEVC